VEKQRKQIKSKRRENILCLLYKEKNGQEKINLTVMRINDE